MQFTPVFAVVVLSLGWAAPSLEAQQPPATPHDSIAAGRVPGSGQGLSRRLVVPGGFLHLPSGSMPWLAAPAACPMPIAPVDTGAAVPMPRVQMDSTPPRQMPVARLDCINTLGLRDRPR
jgi:hypothetical protein